MHDAVSQTPLNEKCLVTEGAKRDVDHRNRDYSYDLEAYAMEDKEAQYPEYGQSSNQDQRSESFFTEVASGSLGQNRGKFNFQIRNPRERGSRTPYRDVNNANSYRGSNWGSYTPDKPQDAGIFQTDNHLTLEVLQSINFNLTVKVVLQTNSLVCSLETVTTASGTDTLSVTVGFQKMTGIVWNMMVENRTNHLMMIEKRKPNEREKNKL